MPQLINKMMIVCFYKNSPLSSISVICSQIDFFFKVNWAFVDFEDGSAVIQAAASKLSQRSLLA